MALEAYLTVDDHPSKTKYRVLECEYEFTQAIDITGRPSDRPRGGMVNLVIVSPDDTDLFLHEWMREKDSPKDGMIELVVNRDATFAPKTVYFKDAHCIKLNEYFNDSNALPMFTRLCIMAGRLVFGKDEREGCEFTMID